MGFDIVNSTGPLTVQDPHRWHMFHCENNKSSEGLNVTLKHITGHFGDDLHSQSLQFQHSTWLILIKLNITQHQEQCKKA